ncbi:hypothetical protein PIROE2DRAFT_9407 [Piromyces sp. E2]|nr:hypothetical protein PIROE2DRAFT_9407 [Piromyces sp. E2]|eukprot:OUM63948.1 hypothetical protein PIROE2DRAFT_9407 [Piromyces sp. E2]
MFVSNKNEIFLMTRVKKPTDYYQYDNRKGIANNMTNSIIKCSARTIHAYNQMCDISRIRYNNYSK